MKKLIIKLLKYILKIMGYKSSIQEDADSINLKKNTEITGSLTGSEYISLADFKNFLIGTLATLSTNTSSNRSTLNLLLNSDLFINDNGINFVAISSANKEIYSDNLKANAYKVSALNTAPSSATDTGVAGEIRYTADYIYVCTATDTWKRVAISTW